MTDKVFCYHCRAHHPLDSVRQIHTRNGKRWRCIKSIEATKTDLKEREAFGRRMTELNRMAAEYRLQNMISPGPVLQIR